METSSCFFGISMPLPGFRMVFSTPMVIEDMNVMGIRSDYEEDGRSLSLYRRHELVWMKMLEEGRSEVVRL
jgi:hypothetical protein